MEALLSNLWLLGGAAALACLCVLVFIAMAFRTVVSTNDVHIVQSAKRTVSYGKDQEAGNTYYAWPAWIPVIGIRVIQLPVSVFDVDLDGYAAYDKGRLPFLIDIMAFFRITDSNVAAQRVSSFPELEKQLQGILQGSCRAILASYEIDEILEGRSTFGKRFTEEVDHNLSAWGVQSVKQIELMDIRDVSGSKVISNIMEKKKSTIERESRVVVAENQREAEKAEIESKQAVQLREQESQQQIGERAAQKEQAIGIAKELSVQAIQEQAKVTAQKVKAVQEIEKVRDAEIQRSVKLVNIDQDRQKAIIEAEQQKQTDVIRAEAQKQTALIEAEQFRQARIIEAAHIVHPERMLRGVGILHKPAIYFRQVASKHRHPGSP